MAYEVYRVRKRFDWRGWQYGPSPGRCGCDCFVKGTHCTGQVGSGCEQCAPSSCQCSCGIPVDRYAGDIWIVEERHPRKDLMLLRRFASGDGSLPSIDDLLEQEEYSRLLTPWKPRERVLV